MNNEDHQELVDVTEHTVYRENPDVGDATLHPTATPTAVLSDPVHALGLFFEEIQNDTETDYGDFMRRANLYINDLMESLHRNPAAVEKLHEMKGYLQFSPDWNIESTRKRLLCDALLLKEMVLT